MCDSALIKDLQIQLDAADKELVFLHTYNNLHIAFLETHSLSEKYKNFVYNYYKNDTNNIKSQPYHWKPLNILVDNMQ